MSDGEELSMEEQLRQLQERVRQLQADNDRLKVSSTPSGGGAEPAILVGGSLTGVNVGGAATSQTSGTSERPERYVYLPRERKCPRFSGKNTDPLPIEEWVEEARRSLAVRHMSRAEQALFLYDLLDGEAKNEIRFRPSTDRVDPDKILTILTETYGCAKSLVSLQQQFFQRKQKEGESIREFSHALLSLMEAVKRRDSTSILNSDALVRDQFIEHVRDGLLRRELKRSVRLNPEVTFLNIRSEAIRWTEDGERAGAPRPRAYSCDSQAQVVSERHVDSQAVAAKANDDLSDIKECLRKQQAQLDRMWQHINSISHPPPMQARGPSGPPRRPYRFQPDGRPICLRCNEPGHIARFCHAELPAGAGSSGRAGAATQGGTAAIGVVNEQQGN
ncbi:hypothetical protein ACEWY4_007622 [Coilia grayii]|uniref:CCHC-type domain-containing protein n=1 Tax=Coilia grayii TaxID=363190 RepID=A0ABD1KGZ8_9TELE